MSSVPEQPVRLLAFGAHPDDIEFGCGGVLLEAASAGAQITLVVGSRGESGTNGTPEVRTAECAAAARQLGAELRFLTLGGDGQIEASREHALLLAGEIRRARPGIVLAPTLTANQHPDHVAIGAMARDAARLARFGGLEALRTWDPHTIEHLLGYAVAPSAEPPGERGLWVDVSPVLADWEALMRCHASQLKTRHYVELQVARARARGLEAGVEAVQVLYPQDALLFSSLAGLPRSVRLY